MPNNSIREQFYADLQVMRDKYPMVYIETWCPDDFAHPDGDLDEGDAVDWKDDKWEDVAELLFRRFDANNGTNWMTIQYTVEEAGH
jgi:hypothetical protein